MTDPSLPSDATLSAQFAVRAGPDKNEPRKHHYVPIFYQKQFANARGYLWVYDRQLKTCKELHPRSICSQTDLYAVKPKGRPRDRRVETEYLKQTDALSSRALREFANQENLDPERLGSLIFFMALQYTRVPANGEAITAIYQAGASDFMEVGFASVDRAKQMLANYQLSTGEELTVTPESMVQAVREKQIEVNATEMPFLQSLWTHTKFVAETLSALECEVLVSPPQTGFVLTDNPVTLVPPPKATAIGFGNRGTYTYFPLTRKFCLRFGVARGSRSFIKLDRESVRFINQNLAINSDRFIMSPEERQLESVVSRSGSTDLNDTPRFSLEKFTDKDGGIIRKLTQLPRRAVYF